MEIRVLRPGMLTTVQDMGRQGHRQQGISAGGAADPFALRIANLLVGNPENTPVLEITLTGPELEFPEGAWVACCGARFEGLPSWRPWWVGPGERINFGARREGCRGYLAVSGGFRADRVMGGWGTHLGAGFGGFAGRPLRQGDLLGTLPAPGALEDR